MIIQADSRSIPLADKSVNCCVTSPPYWGLRDYGIAGQLGLEETPQQYISQMLTVFREVRRVLRDDGTLWLNIGDCYATGAGSGRSMGGKCFGKQNEIIAMGSFPECQPNRMPIEGLKPKDLVGVPWMLAFALRADGWYLRSDIIWSKPNPMPESVTDRPTKAHEYIFLMSKSERYYYDANAIAEEESFTDDMRKPYGPGQVDSRGNGHNRGGGQLRRSAHMAETQRNDGDRWRIADGGVAPRGKHNKRSVWQMPKGKWSESEPQDSGRRMVEATARARAEGMPHDNPFGLKRNKRSVWDIPTNPFPEAHFATFPEALIKPCILAGCPQAGIILDPFAGSGTTVLVARELQCKGIGIELNPAYVEIAKRRLAQAVMEFPLA